jgi:hypothetical protein
MTAADPLWLSYQSLQKRANIDRLYTSAQMTPTFVAGCAHCDHEPFHSDQPTGLPIFTFASIRSLWRGKCSLGLR